MSVVAGVSRRYRSSVGAAQCYAAPTELVSLCDPIAYRQAAPTELESYCRTIIICWLGEKYQFVTDSPEGGLAPALFRAASFSSPYVNTTDTIVISPWPGKNLPESPYFCIKNTRKETVVSQQRAFVTQQRTNVTQQRTVVSQQQTFATQQQTVVTQQRTFATQKQTIFSQQRTVVYSKTDHCYSTTDRCQATKEQCCVATGQKSLAQWIMSNEKARCALPFTSGFFEWPRNFSPTTKIKLITFGEVSAKPSG